jgi:hypothetical protein
MNPVPFAWAHKKSGLNFLSNSVPSTVLFWSNVFRHRDDDDDGGGDDGDNHPA